MRDHRASRSPGLVWLVCLSLPALAGCQNWGKQLYVAHDTKLGIDASINTSMGSGSVDLGYDRRFVTWVPRSVEVVPGSGGEAREVMSVLTCSELRVGLISIDYYDEALATGRAAKKFAEALAKKAEDDKKISSDYFECFGKKERRRAWDGGETRMKSVPLSWLAIGAVVPLGSCADGLVYGERTSISVASVRLNDDPAEPVAVKLGFDRDVVLVAPPLTGNVVGQDDQGRQTTTSGGEAVSQFSTFTVYATPAFLPAGSTGAGARTAELLGVQARFASGEAALAIAGSPEAVAAVMGVSTFVRDDAGELLRQFWKPDGKNIDPDNAKAIRDWMDNHGLANEPSITFFLRAEQFTEQRKQAVKDIGLDN